MSDQTNTNKFLSFSKNDDEVDINYLFNFIFRNKGIIVTFSFVFALIALITSI